MDPRAPGTRAFVTNDLGRFLPDGNLEHLGRVDRAVKIGGLRVDLSELEAALRATDLFQEVVVTTFQDISEECRLVTYVVPRLEKDCSFPAGRQSLQQLLPLPSRFVILRELPVLANGKIDYAQLSEKTAQTLAKEDQAGSDASDALGLQLVRIWEKVLGLDAVGTTDDFFALGGDSLAAATMLAAVDKFCGVTLPTSALLEAPTIQKLADLIRNGGVGETNLRLVALRLRGNKPTLYCVPGAGGDTLQVRLLARHLGEDQPVFAFQPRGFDGRSPFPRSIEEIAKSYIDAMRLHQPRGPYYLCGLSSGGVVAFEMARRLVAEGEEVRFLGLLDSHGGDYPKHRKFLAKFLPLRKRLKLLLLHFLPHGSYFVSLAGLKSGLKQQMKRWLVRRMIALDQLMKFRVFRCPFNLRLFYIQEVNFAARRRYKLIPFSGKIDLFRAEYQPPSDVFEEDPFLGWSGMAAGGIEVHQLPGDHDILLNWLEPATAAVLARKLRACLDKRVAERT
jgi:aspartate racemase